MLHHHFLLLTAWLGSNVFACPKGWWRSRVTDDLCLTQPQRNGILLYDSWTALHWECRTLGATLVSIRTAKEIEELIELVPEKSWIGLASFDPTGNKWQWIRGSSSVEWPLANTTLFWGSENKTAAGRLRCGSLRSNGTIVVSHCGSWQTGICELRLNEPKGPNLPQCIGSGVNSIQNESICYTKGDLTKALSASTCGIVENIWEHSTMHWNVDAGCSHDFKMYVLPTSFADIESMLAVGNPCYDEQCVTVGDTLLILPVHCLPNTNRWLNAYTETPVNWTNWAQPNATRSNNQTQWSENRSGECAVLNDGGFWERHCEVCGATLITIRIKLSVGDRAVASVCVGALENATSSSTIRPATVESGTERARSLCPPGTRQIGRSRGQGLTCFIVSSDRLPWAAAGQRCRAMGGQLVNDSIFYGIYFDRKWSVDGVWIGVAALSGQWARNQNRVNGIGWLPSDDGFHDVWYGSEPQIDESGRILCAKMNIGRNDAKANNCGRSMHYMCELNGEKPLPVPVCRWNSRILTSDPTSCLSVTYRNVSYENLTATCAKFGGNPFLPSSILENEILLANGQKWNENSTSAPAPGQDLVWLGIRLVPSVQNSRKLWTKWAPGHPQDQVDCAVVDASNGRWYSLDCLDSRPSGVCRVPAGSPPIPLHC